jgi:CheY-like chemotaxis protein
MATVLVVDDEPDTRAVLRWMLEDKGHDVLEVANGAEALHMLQYTRHPVVVLLDLHLPLLSGAGVLGAVAADRHLAARHRYILMTARSRRLPAFFATLLTHLHIPVLRTPFDVEELVALVASAAHTLPAQ